MLIYRLKTITLLFLHYIEIIHINTHYFYKIRMIENVIN